MNMFQLDVQLILKGCDRHPGKGIHSYQQYLDHLWQVNLLNYDVMVNHNPFIGFIQFIKHSRNSQDRLKLPFFAGLL